MAVIELDLDAPPTTEPGRPPAHRYRHIGLALAVVLALSLGGAAPVTSLIWRYTGTVPVTGPGTIYAVAGERIYTITESGGLRTTSAWTTDPVRPLWETNTAMPDASAPGALGVEAQEDHLLLSDYPATTVLDGATGEPLWDSPTMVQPLAPGIGLRTEAFFPPGSEYDRTSGDPGELYWTSTGRPHTRPPLRTELYGVDLTSGRRMWTAAEPGSVYAVPTARDGEIIVVAADRISVRAAATGAVLRERALPREQTDGVFYADVVGDVVLLRRARDWNSGGTVTAYGVDRLEPRWQATEPRDNGSRGGCNGLLCRIDETGLAVLDPRTGTVRWHVGPNRGLVSTGAAVVETHGPGGRPLRVRDPVSGATLVELDAWMTVEPGSTLLLTGFDPERLVSTFAIVGSGPDPVRPLGRADSLESDCTVTDRLVACRGRAGIDVWSYRS